MSADRVAPQCAWCGASVPFDSPDGKAPAWLVLCCGADDCVAQREAEECEAEREHERASAR